MKDKGGDREKVEAGEKRKQYLSNNYTKHHNRAETNVNAQNTSLQ